MPEGLDHDEVVHGPDLTGDAGIVFPQVSQDPLLRVSAGANVKILFSSSFSLHLIKLDRLSAESFLQPSLKVRELLLYLPQNNPGCLSLESFGRLL